MIKYPEGTGRRHLHGSEARFRIIYFAMLLLSFQGAVTLFIHSTYLEQFVGNHMIGLLFIVGALLSIVSFLSASRLLQRFGNYRLILGLVALDLVALLGMGFAPSVLVAIPLFILHQALVPLLFFSMDIFLENLIGNKEGKTGSRRGIMLTIFSFASAIAPLGAGFLIGGELPDFGIAYIISAALFLPFGYFIWKYFRMFKDAPYANVEIFAGIRAFWVDRNLRFVFLAHFLLQLFFAWMVIYVPLYLATKVGFGWDSIGLILFVGLMAYVFLEYPIGRIADLYIGEKEMMAMGFLILAISTCWISFISTPTIVPWMVTMFLTRIGASFVEATTESYFFKHADGSDTNLISFFRITRPLAIIVGALFGSIALLYMPFQYIFIALGLSMTAGIAFSFFLEDTK